MALVLPRTPSPTARRLLDLAVLLWAVAWVVVGLFVAREVRGLADLSRTVTAAGYALQEAGGALEQLEGVPFVGGDIGAVGERTERAGRSARESGRSSRESIESLSILLGISIALAPSLPLVALYVPMRVAWTREVRSVRRALRAAPDDPRLEEYLARRAVLTLPYDRLSAAAADPWGELPAAERRRLSDAELARLGIRRPGGRVAATR